MHRKKIAVCTALSLLLVASCEAEGRATAGPAHPEAIDGLWMVELTLESSFPPAHMPPQGSVLGEVALLQNESLDPAEGLSGLPTHSGTYTARFQPFGFDMPGEDDVPTLVARMSAVDSVEIVLQPERDDPVRMHGVLAGDSIAGGWTYYEFRGGGASGEFVMRRP